MWVYLYPNNTETPLKNAYIWIPDPTSIVLDKSAITMTTVGQTEQLTATIEPEVSDKTITWTTSDSTVATVSTSWLVTCVTPWSCTIIATTVNGLTATCGVQQTRLPSAYQEVEYIQSSWTQWIDTWLYANQNTVVETKWNLVQYNSNVSYDKFYWTYWNNWSRCFFLQSNKPEDYKIRTVNYSNSSSTRKIDSLSAMTTGTDYTVKHSATEFWLNWVLQWSCSTISYTSPSTITIFALHDWSSVTQNVYLKLYYFKMYSWTTLERDFVPCYRKSDSVIWLYDRVNDVFYTNQWSWTFTKWPDAN